MFFARLREGRPRGFLPPTGAGFCAKLKRCVLFARLSLFRADVGRLQSTLDQMTLQNLYTKYADPASGSVLLDGFLQFLLSSDNSAIRDESGQDMTRPLTEYYISSSHNVRFSFPLFYFPGSYSLLVFGFADVPPWEPSRRRGDHRGLHPGSSARLSLR